MIKQKTIQAKENYQMEIIDKTNAKALPEVRQGMTIKDKDGFYFVSRIANPLYDNFVVTNLELGISKTYSSYELMINSKGWHSTDDATIVKATLTTENEDED